MKRLAESGFPRHRLTIEITESGLIEDLAAASTLLAQWREAGLRVAIDDFGTGYSSLAYLKSLRSEEHTSELQSLMRTSYAVFCLKKQISTKKTNRITLQ